MCACVHACERVCTCACMRACACVHPCVHVRVCVCVGGGGVQTYETHIKTQRQLATVLGLMVSPVAINAKYDSRVLNSLHK